MWNFNIIQLINNNAIVQYTQLHFLYLCDIVKTRGGDMENIVNIIVNNGVAVGIIVYFMYRDNKFMSNLQKTLTTLETSVNSIQKLIEKFTNEEDNNG